MALRESPDHKALSHKVITVFMAIILAMGTCVPSTSWASSATTATTEEATEPATQPSSEVSSSPTEQSSDAETPTAEEPSSTATESEPEPESAEPEPEASSPEDDEDEVVPMNTVDADGKYSVVVDYVDATSGDKIATSYETVLDEGGTWQAASPEIDGYSLVDSTQTIMSGTADGDNHWQTYTVKYSAKTAAYSVVHMKQLDGGESYYVADTESFTGVAGQTATVAAKSYPGYTCVTTDLTVNVSADGKAVKTVYYDQSPLTYCVWFSTKGGSFVASITGHAGDAVTVPADPTRTGYTFAGWDTTGDGKADPLPTTMPAHNVEAVALWKPAEVGYIINYYKQAGDGVAYKLFDTETATGTTGEATPAAPKKDTTETGTYAYYEYAKENPVTIQADGTSVLDVYYDRVTVTAKVYLEMDDGSKVLYSSKDAPFGVKDHLEPTAWYQAYVANGGTKLRFNRCTSDVKGGIGIGSISRSARYTDFATKTATYTIHFTSNQMYTYYAYRSYQNLDGETYADPVLNASYTVDNNSYGIIGRLNGTTGFTCVACRASTGITQGGYSDTTWSDTWITSPNYEKDGFAIRMIGDQYNGAEWKYTRNTYTDVYYSNGTEVATKDHLYEAEYSTSEVDGKTLTPPAEGYTFAGWYDNEDFKGQPVTSATQSFTPAVYYAKWVPKTVTVTFDSDGGTPVDSETVAKDGMATEPTAPTKASGAEFLGWYYVGKSGVPVRWNFSQALDDDLTLVALWNPAHDSVGYTVIHKTTDGTVLAVESLEGYVSSAVTASALSKSDSRRAGYAYVNIGYQSLELSDDASSNVITFTYTQQAAYEYTVHYVDRATGETLADDNVFGSDSNLESLTARDIAGYTVEDTDGWVSADKREHTFYYTKDPVAADTTSEPEPVSTSQVSARTALPKTGDALDAQLLLSAFIVAIAMGAIVLGRRRKQQD